MVRDLARLRYGQAHKALASPLDPPGILRGDPVAVYNRNPEQDRDHHNRPDDAQANIDEQSHPTTIRSRAVRDNRHKNERDDASLTLAPPLTTASTIGECRR